MEPELKILLHAILIELQTMNNYKALELALQMPSEETAREHLRDVKDFSGILSDIKHQTDQKYRNMSYQRNVEVKKQ